MIDGYLYLIDSVRFLLFRDEILIFFLLAPLLFFHVFLIVYATVSELGLYYRQNIQIGEGGVVSPDIILNMYLTFVLQTTQLRLETACGDKSQVPLSQA